jgi:hypothetical protein
MIGMQHLLHKQAQRHKRPIDTLTPVSDLLAQRPLQLLRWQGVEQLLARFLQKAASETV